MIRSRLAHDFVLSPNIGPRRGGARVSNLVLHYTGMASAARAVAWLCDPASHVSCHYLVDEAGRITQMVGEEMRAWHAGVSSWRQEHDINSASIGIEIHNTGHALGYAEFPGAQMQAVMTLCRDVLSRHAIAGRDVVAHSDIAPQRKSDPGEKFDWRLLHGHGIGHWVEPTPLGDGAAIQTAEATREFQQGLADYGYDVAVNGVLDQKTRFAVTAFQRHFRPERVDGVVDVSTVSTLGRLLRAL